MLEKMKSKKILLIDDDDGIHKAMDIIFGKVCHYTIISALSEKEGLIALINNSDVGAILCDYKMNGYEFTKEIRTNPGYLRYSQIPIIGIDFPETEREFLTKHMQKPLDYKVLVNDMEEIFGGLKSES